MRCSRPCADSAAPHPLVALPSRPVAGEGQGRAATALREARLDGRSATNPSKSRGALRRGEPSDERRGGRTGLAPHRCRRDSRTPERRLNRRVTTGSEPLDDSWRSPVRWIGGLQELVRCPRGAGPRYGDETTYPASARRAAAPASVADVRYLLDESAQLALRELTDLAAQICTTPLAAVTFVDERHTRFASPSGVGLPCDDLSRDLSFCGHAIPQADLFIVRDATLDARFAGTPLVAAPPHVRFYAGAPLITPDGHALGTLCVFDRLPRDLSLAQQGALRVLSRQVVVQLELRRQTRQRAQSEDRLTLATDAACIGVWDWDLTADQWYASPVYCSMLGYPPDRGASDRAVWLERLHPDDRAAVAATIQAAIATHGVSYEYEARMRHADGSYRWIHVVGRVLTVDEHGQATRLLGVRMDVTERKLAELRLRESEDRFRELAENIQEVFWMTDPARRQFLYISPAYEKLWGRSCASLYEAPGDWLAAVHRDDRARVAESMATNQARGDYDETYRILRPDGTVRWIHDRAYSVRDDAGQVRRLVGTAEDITEARQLEAQLRQSQRMEAVGQLAGGVAHDFNNILAAIMMQADLAIDLVDQSGGVHDLLTDIKTATERASNLTRQLLAFSRRQVLQTRVVNLNDVVTEPDQDAGAHPGRGCRPAAEAASPPAAHPRRRRDAGSGADEPGGERAGRHADRRTADHRDFGAPADGGAWQPAARGVARAIHLRARHRYRDRHRAAAPPPHLRALLHDQGPQQGDRPGIGDGLRHRQAARGLADGRQRGGTRRDVPGALALHGGRRERGARAARQTGRVAAAARPSWWWRTRPSFAS